MSYLIFDDKDSNSKRYIVIRKIDLFGIYENDYIDGTESIYTIWIKIGKYTYKRELPHLLAVEELGMIGDLIYLEYSK